MRGASLEIAAGEYVAIVGPSGSGKTTLLSMLGGMLSPTAGRVWLDGVSLYDLSLTERTRLRREKIGFVFQTFNLVPYLTAVENVQVPLYLAGVPAKQQRQRAAALLERVGLERPAGPQAVRAEHRSAAARGAGCAPWPTTHP